MQIDLVFLIGLICIIIPTRAKNKTADHPDDELPRVLLGTVGSHSIQKIGHKSLIEKRDNDVPKVELYYESMCMGCRKFDTTYFSQLVSKLGPHLDISTYPYGKASTTVHYNGSIEFSCQHGPAECYGNTLHACAQAAARDRDRGILFNACLMELRQSDKGSDDNAVAKCGAEMSMDIAAIKKCAKGDKGAQLLKNIGEKSVQAHYTSLPHILINGEEYTGKREDIIKAVCTKFRNPPEACKDSKL